MYDITKLQSFLESMEDFYKAEKGAEKSGIGHEIEHISGVILRAKKYASFVNNDIDGYKIKSPIDYGIVAACAALHDIGNVIERDGHNHFGLGIIKGELTIDDILSVPVQNKKSQKYLSDKEIDLIKKHIKKHGYNISGIDKAFKNVFYDLIKTQFVFELVYFENKLENLEQARNYLMDKYKGLDRSSANDILGELYDKRTEKLNISYNPELHKITEGIQEIFGKGSVELDIIAKAVQDHNIDYKGEKQRYCSRSIYGSIVSDADKDNSPEVFAIRTIAYAVNKLALTKHKAFCLDNNPSKATKKIFKGMYVPNLINCSKHVLHQAFERFRISNKEFEETTGIHASKRPIFKEIAEYKDGLQGAKGIINPVTMPCPETQEEAEDIADGYNYIVDSKHNLITFIIAPNEGEDLYSELDAISKNGKVRATRSKFIEKVREWANPDREKESLKESLKLTQEWLKSKSNEEIIGKYEAEICEELKTGEMKEYSFIEIIKATLNVQLQILNRSNITQDCI